MSGKLFLIFASCEPLTHIKYLSRKCKIKHWTFNSMHFVHTWMFSQECCVVSNTKKAGIESFNCMHAFRMINETLTILSCIRTTATCTLSHISSQDCLDMFLVLFWFVLFCLNMFRDVYVSSLVRVVGFADSCS